MTCGTCFAVCCVLATVFIKLSLYAIRGTLILLKLIWKTCCCSCIVVPVVAAVRYVCKCIFEVTLIVINTICETCGCAKLGGSHIVDALQDCACCAVLSHFLEIFIAFVISVSYIVGQAIMYSVNYAIAYLETETAQDRAAPAVS